MATMRRRAEYTSAPRSSGVASASNHSSAGEDDAAGKHSKADHNNGNIAVTPARVIGAVMAVFVIILVVSGNNEWPPKHRRLRQPPFIHGQIHVNQWKENDIARQRREDNINIIEGRPREERQEHYRAALQPAALLSRDPQGVHVTADVGGNLGPPSVLNQANPGQSWLEDRWQAASDMHGTEIKGSHWIEVDFSALREQGIAFWPAYAILDWETAVSTDYVIYGRRREDESDSWTVFFDSKKHEYDTTTSGKSPGVKKDMPLHYVHNVTLKERLLPEAIDEGTHEETKLIDAIKILIRSSDHGWGVSLWQIDIYGWKEKDGLV